MLVSVHDLHVEPLEVDRENIRFFNKIEERPIHPSQMAHLCAGFPEFEKALAFIRGIDLRRKGMNMDLSQLFTLTTDPGKKAEIMI